MEKTRIYPIFLMVLLLIPIVYAVPSYVFKINEPADLKISCFDIDNTLCNTGVNCYLTVHYPDQTNLFKNGSLTQDSTLEFFNYTMTGLNVSGEYPVVVRCDGNTSGFSTFTFEVNPTGTNQTSILENPLFIIFSILSLVLVGLGMAFKNPWFGFIGSVMFILGGIYIMIYGFNNVTDLYTRSIGVTFLGLGFIFMFTAAYGWLWGDND